MRNATKGCGRCGLLLLLLFLIVLSVSVRLGGRGLCRGRETQLACCGVCLFGWDGMFRFLCRHVEFFFF